MAADFSIQTVMNLRLSPIGFVLLLASAVLLVVSLFAWRSGRVPTLVPLILAAFAGYQIAVFASAARTTLRYLGAPVAPAQVLHYAHIGVVQRARMRIHTYRFILAVSPPDAPMFEASAVIPVQEANSGRLHQGERFMVRYLPGKPDSVMFERQLEE